MSSFANDVPGVVITCRLVMSRAQNATRWTIVRAAPVGRDSAKSGTARNSVCGSEATVARCGSTMTWRAVEAPIMFAVGLGVVVLSAYVAAAGNGSPGRAAYFRYCGACHGADGRGNGEVADSLRVRPADLTQLAKKHDGVFPYDLVKEVIDGRKRVAAHGGSAMPVWGQVFASEESYETPAAHAQSQIGQIADYLSSIQTN